MDRNNGRGYMSLCLVISFFCCGLLHNLLAWSQGGSSAQKAVPRNIFEALSGEAPGEGTITIHQTDAIRRMIRAVSRRYLSVLGREGNTTILMGYRIQYFTGNLRTSRAEAESRAAQIRRLSPETKCYVVYNAPFWRLLCGDFVSHSEANKARQTLREVLPSWASEGYVVRDKVRILNYKPEDYVGN